MLLYCLFVIMLSFPILSAVSDGRIVKTAQGRVRGRREADGVYAFYSIPYATAPTGVNKFKAPLPPPQWKNILEATDKGIACPQAKIGGTKIKIMQEDCLIANVYVPDTKNKKLPVVVYIHGGAFQVGHGDLHTAKIMTKTKNIITITFNYRLGIHGFLCLGTKDAPGNAGMKDIVFMLQWVKKNIRFFGGNPNDVTVSGYSSGAAAADLLILSKSAVGLFNKVIIESGSSLAAFTVQPDPLQNAKTHAKSLNFTGVDDIEDLGEFYKTASYDILTADAFLGRKDSTFLFGPCVERFIGEEIFLGDSPTNILQKGENIIVPMLYGFTNMEGLVRLEFFEYWKTAMNENISEFLPADLKFENNDEKEYVAIQVKEFYFGDKLVDEGTILPYIDYFTDVMFAYPALRSVRLNVESGNADIYLYHYTYADEDDQYVPYTRTRGAGHCAQSFAVLDDFLPRTYSKEYKNVRKMMREIWSDFIKTGDPAPKGSRVTWPATNVNVSLHMSLGKEFKLADTLLKDRIRFWDDIYQQYYREPVKP